MVYEPYRAHEETGFHPVSGYRATSILVRGDTHYLTYSHAMSAINHSMSARGLSLYLHHAWGDHPSFSFPAPDS